jgi:cytochrome c2
LEAAGEVPAARTCVTCRHFRARAHAGTAAPHHCDVVGRPFGERELRVECADHETADSAAQGEAWTRFAG